MSRWVYAVDVSDVWHDDALAWSVKRDVLVERVRASAWYRDHADEDLEDVCVELLDAQTVAEFDAVFADLYDVADEHRAWIETFGRRPR